MKKFLKKKFLLGVPASSAPIVALPKNPNASFLVSRVVNAGNFFSKRVKVQNKNRIVKALEKTDIKDIFPLMKLQ